MTLYNLLNKVRSIALDHESIEYSEVGHEWDVSAQKQNYMACWIETPVSINYLRSDTKQFTLAFSILQLNNDYDDLDQVLLNTSDCEDVGDDLLHAFIDNLKAEGVMVDLNSIGAVTLRHFTNQDLVGVRYDLSFNLQSNARCYKTKMQ